MPPRAFSTYFPADDHPSLMNGMDQTVADRIRSCAKLDVQHGSCDYLERFPERLKGDLNWNVFVSDRNDGLLLCAIHRSKF